MNETTVMGRPRQSLQILPRLGMLLLLMFALAEGSVQLASSEFLRTGPGAALVRPLVRAILIRYWPVRVWVIHHSVQALVALACTAAILVIAARYLLLLWHNQIVARLSGTYFKAQSLSFPTRTVDLFSEIGRRPKGMHFVGLTRERSLFGRRWRPVYISPRQRAMHRHVIGKTGSGKTLSVLWPSVLQDALDGKGILVMDAKGSDETISTMKAVATIAGRKQHLRVFALPAWNQPQRFSHSYNMVHVRPKTPSDPGGDPAATAERVFSVFSLGDNQYYNTQAQIMFVNLCKLLHGMVDDKGAGVPFNMSDLSVCFKGIGAEDDWAHGLNDCLHRSTDQRAAREIQSQISRLGREAHKCFSGVVGAIDKFQSALVNAYEPDIVFESVLQNNEMVYVQLPANLFKIQAPAMGKVMLMDVQQEGSLRQVFRRTRNQKPFSVTVDEFYNFADLSIIDSLNKLRDANVEFTLAHQSIADLELVSKEFASAVWDNTTVREILAQDNPELCEKLAKSIGTHQVVEKTVRMQRGPLFTSLATGDVSSKLVEAYKLHPNAIKSLARCGQGYLFNDEGIRPVCYGMLPALSSDFPLKRKDQAHARGLRLYDRFIARKPLR
jgi:type IV secretory pathway TraG/TraD family ATPase VirD4